MELVPKMLAGDQRSLARLITVVENDAPQVPHIMKSIYPHLGRAYCLGVTGPPGGGKSTLVDRLTALARKEGHRVGIVAVDPSSPFTGGAVLGDRIRMQQHYLDKGVFIRSMATRGSRGGLPRTARNVTKLLDAFGMDLIMVETVGVGQTELDIVEAADTVVVVLVPEAGDTIQTMKAGLMEIADIFVVNKADREGADYVVLELEAMLSLSPQRSPWRPPVLATQALNNVGIEELYRDVLKHRRFLGESGQQAQKRRQQRREELVETIEQRFQTWLHSQWQQDGQLKAALERVERGEIDPYTAYNQLFYDQHLLKKWLSQLEKEMGPA